jgi:PHD/YefM family antitoxin component YafN of YafNO toxin-antitoxin module
MAIPPQRSTTMRVTATQAKNRFGAICTQAKTEPVFVEKDGRIDTVILSADQFDALNASVQWKSLKQQKKAFDQTHKAWIDEQNARFEKHGLWCDDLRVW